MQRPGSACETCLAQDALPSKNAPERYGQLAFGMPKIPQQRRASEDQEYYGAHDEHGSICDDRRSNVIPREAHHEIVTTCTELNGRRRSACVSALDFAVRSGRARQSNASVDRVRTCKHHGLSRVERSFMFMGCNSLHAALSWRRSPVATLRSRRAQPKRAICMHFEPPPQRRHAQRPCRLQQGTVCTYIVFKAVCNLWRFVRRQPAPARSRHRRCCTSCPAIRN